MTTAAPAPTRPARARWVAHHRVATRFESPSARVPLVLAGACFLVIGVAGILGDEQRFASALAAAAGLVLVLRGHSAATVLVEDDRVVLVGFTRHRTIELTELRSAEVRARTPDWPDFSPEFIVLHLDDGRTVQFRELNARHREGRESVVDRAVSSINTALARAPMRTANH